MAEAGAADDAEVVAAIEAQAAPDGKAAAAAAAEAVTGVPSPSA